MRDKLVGLLWPDSDAERARHLLSDSIYRINQAAGGEAIVAAGEELRIDEGRLSCDVREFADAVAREDWTEAARLSDAPFLDGFFLPGAAEFEQWADAARERFARERSHVLENLAGIAATAGDHAGAVRWWRTLAAHEPYSSRVALGLMHALEHAGDAAAAVQHARSHTDLLRTQLEIDAHPEIHALAGRLRTTRPPPAVVPPPPRRLAERRAAHIPEGVAAEPSPRDDSVEPGDRPDDRDGRTPETVPRRRRWVVAAILAVIVVAAIASWFTLPEAARGNPESIAVLPFADLSPAGDAEYFGDGIAEELMARLANIDGLRVVGRTSAFAFKGRRVDTREIGARLGVAVVLTGSVRKAASTVRIIAQLVDARTGYEIWSESYERPMRDVFVIQDEIARAIARRLDASPGGSPSSVPGAAPIQDPESYNLYLRGRFEWHRRTEHSLRLAASYFRAAAERSPGYARAYAGLGDAEAVLGFYDYLPPNEAFPAAAVAARRALELDPDQAEPHATLGYVALYHDWDWTRAEAEFMRTVELNPAYSTGHQWYANLLTAMGRFDEAEREMRVAQEMDPLSLIANAARCWVLYYAGDHGRAIEQCDRTIELNADFELAHLWRGLALGESGNAAAEIDALERAVALSGGSAISVASLARARAASGDTATARALLDRLERKGARAYVPSYEIAKVHEALGDREAALRWLRLALEQRSHSIVFLKVDPQLRRLRDDPDFIDMMRRAGLT